MLRRCPIQVFWLSRLGGNGRGRQDTEFVCGRRRSSTSCNHCNCTFGTFLAVCCYCGATGSSSRCGVVVCCLATCLALLLRWWRFVVDNSGTLRIQTSSFIVHGDSNLTRSEHCGIVHFSFPFVILLGRSNGILQAPIRQFQVPIKHQQQQQDQQEREREVRTTLHQQ
jgi:hypothetical protein